MGKSFRKLMIMLLSASLVIGNVTPAFAAEVNDEAAEAETAEVHADTEDNIEIPASGLNGNGGTDYYLDATGGDDNNLGTSPDQAWQNLTKANETTFQPGDRILLKAGETWENQQLWPKGSGSEGKPIIIDMYGDASLGKPYIAANGNVECPGTGEGRSFVKDMDKVGLTGAVVLRNQQYWEIHNLEISNDDDFSTDITGTNPPVVRDGISISIQADLLEGETDKIMNYFRISDCYIHDIDGPSSWQLIHYGGICFQVFGKKTWKEYEDSAYYFQDVRIENNQFMKVELHAIQFAFNWFGGNNINQYDETGKLHEGWEQLWVREKDLYSRDVYIGHNYCESIGQGAIQLANTKDMVVEYNEINGFLERYSQVSCGLYLWAGADTVMQYNEVYGGPYNEYDGSPWDLEYTNFDVTYQYNYSHDNKAGWMSYMGNSANSIARYNLSVNDNGVIVKNMLSTNYSPTYFVNNVFIYDASQMDYFHDEYFKDTVYFVNNVFYNYSTDTPTKWYRRSNAFDKAVFSNNVYYEAGGEASKQEPKDIYKITANPQFKNDPLAYAKDLGVNNIMQAAAHFELEDNSPLIDAGHYLNACGTIDFFGNHLYYGEGIDIGIQEKTIGTKVENPVEEALDTENEDERVNLALHKPITASSTHTNNGKGGLEADKLVDGDKTTRWACADPTANTYPVTITIDFGESVIFDELFLDEYEDDGTELRIEKFELQRWDEKTNDWVTFKSVDTGMGRDLSISDFGKITSRKLQLKIIKVFDYVKWSPSITEIQVYNNVKNLALNKPVSASSTHANNGKGGLEAEKLVDEDKTTRWACADPAADTYPITLTIDFEESTTFDEVFLDEYEDDGTELRIEKFELQRWNAGTGNWETFKSVDTGMGRDLSISDFGKITTTKLQIKITKVFDYVVWSPSMTEIQVYYTGKIPEVPADANPQLSVNSGTFDLNMDRSDDPDNVITIPVIRDCDFVDEISYYGSEGNKLRELLENEDYILDNNIYTLKSSFLKTIKEGTCTIRFTMVSGKKLDYTLTVIDSSLNAPANFTIGQENGTSIRINWDAVSGADGYEVHFSTTQNGTYAKATATTAKAYTHTGLAVGQIYYYKLCAYKTINGKNYYSNYTSVKSLTLPVPSPSGITASAAGATSIKVNWTKANGITGYEVYASTSRNGTYQKIGTTVDTSYIYNSLAVGTTYYFKVRSYKTISGSNKYSDYTGVVSRQLAVPAPTKVKAAGVNAVSIKLSWTKASGVSGYEIYRAAGKNGTYKKVGAVSSSKSSYTDKSLANKKTYFYKVRAYKTVSGNKSYSGYSGIVSAKTGLSKPSNFKAVKAGSKAVKLSWKKVTGATGYEVYRATGKNGRYKKITTVSSSKTSYTNKGLAKGKRYYYRIRAIQKVNKKTYNSSYTSKNSVKL